METERLRHRKFTPDDLEKLIAMRSDPDVMRYIGGAAIQNPAMLKKRLEFYISCYDQKIGLYGLIWRETGEMIGWSGLQPLEETAETEVSYGLVKEYWGRGIGFETAQFWLRYGFETLQLKRIVAVADEANVGSWRIMEKLGMHYKKTVEHYGMECVFYAVSRKEFLAGDHLSKEKGKR